MASSFSSVNLPYSEPTVFLRRSVFFFTPAHEAVAKAYGNGLIGGVIQGRDKYSAEIFAPEAIHFNL